MKTLPDPLEHRRTEYPIEPLLLKRWSPRAMNGEAITEEEWRTLIEAARWAPSTYNEQEWRFLYAHRDSQHWDLFFNLLVEANQSWCHAAGILVAVLSTKFFERNGKPNPVHTFDAGAAFENLALQGAAMGLVVHGMAGFDAERARRDLKVPEELEVEAMVAIGRPGDPGNLPDALREREVPSGRHPIDHFLIEGPYVSG